MLNDTNSYLQCENEDYTLLYMAIVVMTSSSIAITTLMSFVVWIAKRRKRILQTPQRLWLRPLDLLMGNQVHVYYQGLSIPPDLICLQQELFIPPCATIVCA